MPSDWKLPDERSGVLFRLCVIGYDSLRWGFELNLKGYYIQSFALVRQGWESWLHGAYLHLYPEREVSEWRDFRSRPKPSQMRKAVADRSSADGSINEDFRAALNDLADTYAALAHPTEDAVSATIALKGDELWVLRGGAFDRARFLRTVNLLSLTANLLASLIWILLPEERAYYDEGQAMSAELAKWGVTG
jgi:hypothetical protein